jgi:protein SCO1/2
MIRQLLVLLCSASQLTADGAFKEYDVRGIVREIRWPKGELLIRHNAIPGYMGAMVMPFTVRDPNSLKKVAIGDEVGFRLHVSDADDWIDNIHVITRAVPGAQFNSKAKPSVAPLQLGDPFPECILRDELGVKFNLSDYKGRPFAYTFLFTQCSFPKMCPLLSQKFERVQSLLGGSDAQLLSISIDPEHDTPKVLLAYAAAHKAERVRWRFATGQLKDITLLAQQSGAQFWDEKGTISHNLRTLVVGQNGRIRGILDGNDWTPEELADLLLSAE